MHDSRAQKIVKTTEGADPHPEQICGALPSASELGRRRIQACRGEPLFLADWRQVLMVHFEVENAPLQSVVPFELDLWHGRAFVTLVSFTMRRMRPRRGGWLTSLFFAPLANSNFLNVRTYVRVNGEPGIHFLSEWLSNPLAVAFGPATFSLPYQSGKIYYQNEPAQGGLSGKVVCPKTRTGFEYDAQLQCSKFARCPVGSLSEWLLERYAAFNAAHNRQKYFRVWHPPWQQSPVGITLRDSSLLTSRWGWFAAAQLTGAHFSPGFDDVWLGWPRHVSPKLTRQPTCLPGREL